MTETSKTEVRRVCRAIKKYGDPLHRFEISIRDLNHFTSIIEVLNKNCGTGMKCWSMTKKVRKFLKYRRGPVKTDVLIFNDEDISPNEIETLVKLL